MDSQVGRVIDMMIRVFKSVTNRPARSVFLALFMAWCALLSACGAPAAPPIAAQPAAQPQPSALPPQPTPPALTALAGRVSPCDRLADSPPANHATATPPATLPAGSVHYDNRSNTILLRKGADTTLAGIGQVLGATDALQELAPGEWLLTANLRVEAGARLRVAAPEVRWLKLRSDPTAFVWVKALGGELEFADTCISSWDPAAISYDETYQDGRSYVLARDGARLDIQRSDLRYLGYDGPESYGLAWRVRGTSGQIVDSFVSHNFYGVYSFEVDDLVIRANEIHHNVMYGIDPHTRSNRLVIEGNVSHDNGKHGIILADACSDSVIRNNVAYNNLHHGIVIYQGSNNNLLEANTAYGNGGQGINVNDAANTTVRGNTVYNNLEAGIGVGQRASATQVVGNKVQANRRDGVTLYSDAADNQLRDNLIAGNARYGIYVKSDGKLTVEGNQVAGNTVGVYLNTAVPIEISQQTNQIHSNREADLRRGLDQAPAGTLEDQP
jgi:parallel beta-helix repeat protein